MSLTIQTNVASIAARRNLASAQSALDGSLSRLSSGVRITRSSDDAAGLGVSSRLEARIRSAGQAVRNAGHGWSLVQAAEAGLLEQANLLVRLRELAMQSASDGIGPMERAAVDREAQKLVSELGRISQVAEYNGTKLLDGSARVLQFRVGLDASDGDVIPVTTVAAVAGQVVTLPTPLAFMAAAHTAFVASMSGGASAGSTATALVAARAAAGATVPPTVSGNAGNVSFYAYLAAYFAAGGTGTGSGPLTPAANAGLAAVASMAPGGPGTSPVLEAAFQAYAAEMSKAGATEALASAAAESAAAAVVGDVPMAASAAVNARNAAVYLFRAAYSNTSGAAFPARPNPASAPYADAVLALSGIDHGPGIQGTVISLATKAGALASFATIDAALTTVSSAHADLGAAGNRLQHAVATLQASVESLSAANARIKDVDVAEESSRLARAQILAQAGASILAQANQRPELALKLLG